MSILELSFAGGERSLSVRRFSLHETISSPFILSVGARSEHANIDLEGIVGQAAGLRIVTGMVPSLHSTRTWTGVCSHIEQVQAEPTGLSTYYLRIVPRLWLLNQRRGNRIYQHLSIPEIVVKLLAEWSITPELRLDGGNYPKLEYKVQCGESKLVLADALEKSAARPGGPVTALDNPSQAAEREFVTHVRLSHEVRPG